MRITIITLFLILATTPLFSQRDLETITSPEDLEQFIYYTAPSEDAFIAVQRLAKPYIDKKDWKGAIEVFNDYKDRFLDKFLRTEKIIELLNAPTQNLQITNLETVNSSKGEYFPVLTIDGERMYFTLSDGRRGGEDIYYSQLKSGTWVKPNNMGSPFSTKENDAVNSVSADGNMLVLFGSYNGFIGGGDNFYVEKTATGWSEIKPFPKPINSTSWDCDGFLTADRKSVV